jgi:integral membrane protein (TIGR01906 family)
MRTTAAPRVSAAPDLLTWARTAVSIAFVVLLPLLLIGTSLRSLVSDRDLILRGFRDNRVAVTTGLDDPQLQRIADAFVAYFQAAPSELQMQVTVGGQTRPLFNQREVEHMQDVQALVQLFLRLQLVAAAVGILRVALAIFVDRSPAPIGRELLMSAGLIVGLVVLVGLLSLVDFSGLWTRFHQVAFRNDLWQLDPRTDYLIMLFPEPFWFTATLNMAMLVALHTFLIIASGLVLLYGPHLLGASER